MSRVRPARTALATVGLALGLAVSASLPVAAGAAGAAGAASGSTRASCLVGGAPVSAAAAVGGEAHGGFDHGRRPGGDAHGADDTPTLSAAQKARAERQIAEVAAQRSASRSSRAAATIEVPVYFNILRYSDPRRKGYYASVTSLRDTITVLNQTYASAGFHFTQVAYRYVNQTAWYTAVPDTSADRAMRSALHRGGRTALNVYLVNPPDGTLGWSSLPQSGLSGSRLAQDGVALNVGSTPGGRISGYNQGKTATHEVGHWLSLYHTFEGYGFYRDGGCSPFAGDEVGDTPAEYSPTVGCPASRNSCPAAGVDPIHNYMDYSTDPCMTNFTAGQQQRMRDAWTAFRA